MYRTSFTLSFHHICRLESLRTLDDIEFDLITLGQRLEAIALDCRKMHEYVFSAVLLDETKALGVVEPLHSTVSHCSFTTFLP